MNIEDIVKQEFDKGLKFGKYTLGFFDDILEYKDINFNKIDLKEGKVIVDIVYLNYSMDFSIKEQNSHYPRIDSWFSKTFHLNIKPYIRNKKINKVF